MDFGIIATSNPEGENNLQLQFFTTFGDLKQNIKLGAFYGGCKGRKNASFGIHAKFTSGRYSISLQQINSVSQRSLCAGLDAIIFKNDKHTISGNTMLTQTHMDNGRLLQRRTLGLTYNNSRGYGATIFTAVVPQIPGFIVHGSSNVNLWTSSDNSTTLDFTVNFAHHCSGLRAGYTGYGWGFGFTRQF